MTVGVGASGFIGIQVETTTNTYIAPSLYLPLLSESLQYKQDAIKRRPLRGLASVVGYLPGNVHVEGDISVEVTHETLPFILRAARATCVKTGAGPYVYTWTPTAVATPTKTLSITVVRNGFVFGYVGCIISSMKFTINNGQLNATFGIIGSDEASQSLPTPTYILTTPAATGQFTLEIPTTTQVFDADSFEFSVEDNGDPQYRLQSGGALGARFIKYGERNVMLSINRDFEARTEYDAFKVLTAKSITLKAIKNVTTDAVTFIVPAAIVDDYPIEGLAGQADLIRANVKYTGVYDVTSSSDYQIIINSSVSVTIP